MYLCMYIYTGIRFVKKHIYTHVKKNCVYVYIYIYMYIYIYIFFFQKCDSPAR